MTVSRKYKGFTLVELIVVITILVILGTIAFLNLGGFQSNARDGRRVSDMSNISKVLDIAIVTQGNAPIPSNYTSYTGGLVTLQVGTITSTTVPRMNGDFTDPLTKTPYNYSIFNNSRYYQIGIDFENSLSYHTNNHLISLSGIETVYAATSTSPTFSKLSGTYSFDPSLPSLFPISGTVSSASGGIFSPDACFVMNNISTNTFSSNSGTCLPKNKMSLNTLDTSLVGYWDMETLTGALLKDLSGNGNDGVFSGTVLPTSTGGYLGKGYYFSGSGIIESVQAIDYHASKELTIEAIYQVTDTSSMTGWINGGQIVAESSDNWNFNTGSYLLDDFDKTNVLFTDYKASGGIKLTSDPVGGQYFLTRTTQKSEAGWKILTLKLQQKDGGTEAKLFLNGVEQNDSMDITANIYKILDPTARNIIENYNFYIGNRKNYKYYPNRLGFLGIIDDIKVYTRALSDDDIKQHAKIAGF